MRRFFTALWLVFVLSNVSFAQNMTITGTVRNLDGTPIENLLNFTVEAFSGGQRVAAGALITNAPPFVYRILIDANQVNPNDVRVLLAFRATGRDNVDFDKVTGRAANLVGGVPVAVDSAQTVDVVMPEAQGELPCCYRRGWFSHRFRAGRGH